jgi:acyl-CoA synthetase (NDP forming)
MRSTAQRGLARLFAPQSVAIIGASTAEEKVGYQLVSSLRKFNGRVYPINPKATEIAGHRAYPSLQALPEAPDLAILAIPASACPAALAEAASAGVGGALICSGGFGESGETGAQLQAQIEHTIRTSSIRLLGPNTVGFTNPVSGCHACFLPTVQEFAPGNLAIVAQSGGVNLTLSFLARKQGLGLRLAIGLGNAVDVDAGDVIEYLADDELTKVIVVHLEGVRHGRKLFDAVARASAVKPVIALPVGRGQVADFAQSHTGNLMGSFAITAAALKQAGAIVVESTDAAIDAAAAFAAGRIPPKANPGVAVLTGQAGPGLIMLDALRTGGVDVPPLSDATVAKIATLLPPMTYIRNPVDTGRPSPTFTDVLIATASDPVVDVLLTFALDEPAALDAPTVFSRAASSVKQPIIFGTLGIETSVEPTQRELTQRNIPTYQSPDRAARAVRALVDDSKARHRRATEKVTTIASSNTAARAKDEVAAKTLLREYGLRSPRSVGCDTQQHARESFAQLQKPVVVKVLDTLIAHKTEVGGVYLNVRSDAELTSALDGIDAIPGDRAERRYLLEEMAGKGIDLILGAKRDASFGPTVMIGLGGIEAEALKDVSIRIAPLTRLDAIEMLSELRGSVLLDGWRGAPPANRNAIVDAILSVSTLICSQTALLELDINPLRADTNGVTALDALRIWQD